MRTKWSNHLLIGILTAFLVFPAHLMAINVEKDPGVSPDPDSLPVSFSIHIKGTDRTFYLARSNGGYDVRSSDGSYTGFLYDSELQRVRVRPAKRVAPETYYSNFSIEDATGSVLPYGSIVRWDGRENQVDASVTLPDGGLLEMSIETDGAARQEMEKLTKAVICVVVITGTGVLLCWAGSYTVECGEECSDACDEQGVDNYDEGLCGTSCECECNDPEGGGPLEV